MASTDSLPAAVESLSLQTTSETSKFPNSYPSLNPVDVYREHISEHLSAITGIEAEKIYPRLQFTSTLDKGDLLLPVPSLQIKGKSPADLSKELAEKFPESDLIHPPIAGGPGGTHLQFFFKEKPLAQRVIGQIFKEKAAYGSNGNQGLRDPKDPSKGRKKIIVEFSSPNIAKPFHAGHLRSTIIGGFLANLYTVMGWDVIKMNYLGDWGKQYGLLANGYKKFGDEQKLLQDPINHLFEVYVKINNIVSEQEGPIKELKEQIKAKKEKNEDVSKLEQELAKLVDVSEDENARRYFKSMEDGDPDALSLWRRFRDLSIKKYRETYARLNIDYDVYSGESQIKQESMSKANEILQSTGVSENSDGATIVDFPKHGAKKLGKAVIVRKDGTPLYLTRDIGAIFERDEAYHFDKMIYVVAAQQDLHLAQLFKIVELMGFKDLASRCFDGHCYPRYAVIAGCQQHFRSAMDDYPRPYIANNLPFILLCGLEADGDRTEPEAEETNYPLLEENGIAIESDLPPLERPVAEEFRDVFFSEAGPRSQDNGIEGTSRAGYKVKSIGRNYRLPPRKANPPPASPPESPTVSRDHGLSMILHSPISPLTPASPTFPDGIMTPLWASKHQDLVPAAVINFFPFCLDSTMNSLRDNQLKIEINGLKKQWSSSGYRTRFIVVLLSEKAIGDDLGDLDDRVLGIRRATNLDQKSLFILPPDVSSEEMRDFTRSLLALLHPSLMEYYRDLSKHARRKRNRSSIPPPTAPPTSGTSQTLSLQGWNTRYEFKMGIFAEFRQEIDAALKNYESAYETLFGQEVFENIAGWDPKFNEARLFSDALAIRIIRCLLSTGHTSSAVRSWVYHRRRTQDIVNRRGKGTRNYGWEAWEARWSSVMAQLIHQAKIPHLTPLETSQNQVHEHNSIFVPPEKTFLSVDEVLPWERLHHEGYWLYRSAKHTMHRRTLAGQIPAEDRMPPGQSPASHIASKAYLYDTYLAPETHIEAARAQDGGVDHSTLILDTLKAALVEFSKRNQVRMTESLSLEIAEEYMRLGSWIEAYETLRPLWPALTWRRSGWWLLMAKFAWILRECAARAQDSETVLRVDWELLNFAFPPRPDWNYDIHQSLAEFASKEQKPSIVIKAEDVVSSVTATFIFQKAEGNVGEPLQCQLVLRSCAQKSSVPVRFAELRVAFEGCLRPIRLQSDQNIDADTSTTCLISSPSLRDPSATSDSSVHQSTTSALNALTGIADLTLGPAQTKVYNLACIPRESGESRVASIALLVSQEDFDLTYAITDLAQQEAFWWQQTTKGPARRRVGKGRDVDRCKIQPKPPKIRLTIPNLKSTYYTNERIVLNLVIDNGEDEAADVVAEARLFGSPDSAVNISWLDQEGSVQASTESRPNTPAEEEPHSLKRSVGVIESSSQREIPIVISGTESSFEYELEVSAAYNLFSDIQTPIIATTRLTLPIIRPFEANYEFLPRLNPLPWPDFFTIDDDLTETQPNTEPRGLQQRWCLDTKVVSFAREPLVIENMSIAVLSLSGGAISQVGHEVLVSPETREIHPEDLRHSNFVLDIQKIILGDRRPTSLNLALEIQWRRSGEETDDSGRSDRLTTTKLAIPRFVIPAGEPRVLASAISSRKFPGLIHVEYTLENPSLHFLTFSLTMEASEYFAFSGPKTMVVQLAPVSRQTVRYNLLASKRGLWIQPQLLVVDTYFNKSLRVLPTEDMRSDKKGILIWVDAED